MGRIDNQISFKDVQGGKSGTFSDSVSLDGQELATLMAAISDAVLAIDSEGAPLFYNSRFALLFPVREGVYYRDILPDGEIREIFARTLSQGVSNSLKAFPLESSTGKKFFSLSVAPLKRKNGVTYGALGIFHDVTELKLAEKMRIDFVANVSHELRTPLTSIQGYTETLVQDHKSGRALDPDFLESISRNVRRLRDLIGDLLDLSALESSPDKPLCEVINTKDITERVLSHLESKFKAHRHKIDCSYSVDSVYADPHRLEQVLINLLDNAGKYTPEGGLIHVVWQSVGSRGGVLLKIKDNGPGIAPKHHSRLFERFYRVDKARSRTLGGTGLGLAIVKHIMQNHKGYVSVESDIGKGATFECYFPPANLI